MTDSIPSPQWAASLPAKRCRRFWLCFLKGPIPLTWLSAAARLPGKALHVGLWV
jgi:hypothetical protein